MSMTKETPEFKETFGAVEPPLKGDGDFEDFRDRIADKWYNFVEATKDALNEETIPIDGLGKARNESEAEAMGDIRAYLTHEIVERALLKTSPQLVALIKYRNKEV